MTTLTCLRCEHDWVYLKKVYEGRDVRRHIKSKNGPIMCPKCKMVDKVRIKDGT